MPRGVKKENLPSKVCVTCNRPFTWRKKWERCWDEVTTCSKSCNRKRRESSRPPIVDTSAAGNSIQSTLQEVSSQGDAEEGTQQTTKEDAGSKHVPAVEREDTAEGEITERRETVREDYPFRDDESEKLEFDSTAILDLSMLAKLVDGIENVDDASTCVPEKGSRLAAEDDEIDPVAQRKADRKAAKKEKKLERRAHREGRGDPSAGQKPCDMCSKSVDLLIRCTYDESLQWNMVCGKCWNKASGGVVDGDSSHPYYRYGGLWKNRRAQK